MINKNIIRIAIIAALTAIVVVVVLKLLGQSNPTVTGGAVAGAVAGALAASFGKTKSKE